MKLHLIDPPNPQSPLDPPLKRGVAKPGGIIKSCMIRKKWYKPAWVLRRGKYGLILNIKFPRSIPYNSVPVNSAKQNKTLLLSRTADINPIFKTVC